LLRHNQTRDGMQRELTQSKRYEEGCARGRFATRPAR
jgi:hypothetical protein